MSATNVVVAYAKHAWKPYRDCFPAKGDTYVAITIPGAYSGFGETPDIACMMAMKRAAAAADRAEKRGFSLSSWISAVSTKTAPGLIGILSSALSCIAAKKPETLGGLQFYRIEDDRVGDLAPKDLCAA